MEPWESVSGRGERRLFDPETERATGVLEMGLLKASLSTMEREEELKPLAKIKLLGVAESNEWLESGTEGETRREERVALRDPVEAVRD